MRSKRLKIRNLATGLLAVSLALAPLLVLPQTYEEDKSNPDAERAAQSRRMIISWLECEECTDGELQAVVRLGDVVVPSLTTILRDGPSPSRREIARRSLVDAYRQLRAYGETHPEASITMSEDEYVEMYLGNYVANYQTRAATALAAIGGDRAKQALEAAMTAPSREDVRQVVAKSLEEMNK